MPKILDDCVKSVGEDGSVDNPWAVCIDSLHEKGYLKQDGSRWELTEKGKKSKANIFEKISKEELDKSFVAFMKDLVRVSQEQIPQSVDAKFKDLRNNYAKFLPIWRETLSASHKGLFLCIQDLDSWSSGHELKPYLSKVLSLYASTIEEAIEKGSIDKIARKHILSKIEL